MITFLNDWKRAPGAIVHMATKNKSFLHICSLYKKMGIKNYFFPLALLQKDLEYVDPFDEDLTEDVKLMVAIECKYNPWYFLREVCRIPPNSGNTPVQFRANRGNIALVWSFLNHIDFALIQPRQTGKSVSTDALMTWLMYFSLNNSTIALLTKDDTLRVANIERLKKLRDLLPSYLVYGSKSDANNLSLMTYRALGNKYLTAVAQNSEMAANNTLRGNSIPILHNDEGPFISYIDVALPAALAAGNAARDEAKEVGGQYGNIFTTTAGKIDDRSGRYMYDMIMGGATWSEHFFDCANREELVAMVESHCRKGAGRKVVINCTLSHRQLGLTDEWLMEQIGIVGGTEDSINRDFFNIWTSGTQSSPLSIKLNEAIAQSEMDPVDNEIFPQGFVLNWYVDRAEYLDKTHCVIGLDTSEAIGSDDIGLVIRDVRNLKVLAVGCYNETNIYRFADFVAELLDRYRKTTLIIERKSTATSILGVLMHSLPERGIDPFRRIFNHIVDNAHDRKDEYRQVCTDMSRRPGWFYDKTIRDFGFVTTSQNRDYLYGAVLQNTAKKAGHLVHDKKLSGQIRQLVVRKGRIDHEKSGHDDLVIGWLLCHWFLTEARNLDFYGIQARDVLSLVTEETRTLTEEELREKEEQLELKDQINQALEDLQVMADEILIARYEHRLRTLYSKLRDFGELPRSADELIQRTSEKRRLKARMKNYERAPMRQQGQRQVNPFGGVVYM